MNTHPPGVAGAKRLNNFEAYRYISVAILTGPKFFDISRSRGEDWLLATDAARGRGSQKKEVRVNIPSFKLCEPSLVKRIGASLQA